MTLNARSDILQAQVRHDRSSIDFAVERSAYNAAKWVGVIKDVEKKTRSFYRPTLTWICCWALNRDFRRSTLSSASRLCDCQAGKANYQQQRLGSSDILQTPSL